jgi:hypothetical protein
VGPLGLGDRAFDCYMIYFFVGSLALSLVVGFGIRAVGDCKDGAVG